VTRALSDRELLVGLRVAAQPAKGKSLDGRRRRSRWSLRSQRAAASNRVTTSLERLRSAEHSHAIELDVSRRST
jgi:hypothetical protein